MNDQDYVDDLTMAFKKGRADAFIKVEAALLNAIDDVEGDFEMAEGLDLALRIVKNLK
jgi:hypothetical protein